MKKIILLFIILLINIQIAFAQTGLFDAGISTTFATAGIVIVIVIFVLIEFFKRFTNKK